MNECHNIDGGPCDGMDCINTDGFYHCLGRSIDPVVQDGHLIGESIVTAGGTTTGVIVGASISSMVLTVLLGVGVGMGFRWYEKRKKTQQ